MDESTESETPEPDRTITAAEIETLERVFNAPVFDDEDLVGLTRDCQE